MFSIWGSSSSLLPGFNYIIEGGKLKIVATWGGGEGRRGISDGVICLGGD